MLGVAPGAPAHEVRRQYQKIYNDHQIRLTNAPTASLKRMYQKNLQELKAAAEVLAPGLLAGWPEPRLGRVTPKSTLTAAAAQA